MPIVVWALSSVSILWCLYLLFRMPLICNPPFCSDYSRWGGLWGYLYFHTSSAVAVNGSDRYPEILLMSVVLFVWLLCRGQAKIFPLRSFSLFPPLFDPLWLWISESHLITWYFLSFSECSFWLLCRGPFIGLWSCRRGNHLIILLLNLDTLQYKLHSYFS